MVDFKRLSSRAKDLVEKRGGSESLKRDADELKGIAKGPGSFKDKAKAAVDAIKDPGAAGEEVQAETPPPASETAEPGRGEGRGQRKARGDGGAGRGRGGRGGRGNGRGRKDGPAAG